MNSKRYVPVGDDVYIDKGGIGPYRLDLLLKALGCGFLLLLSATVYTHTVNTHSNAYRASCQSNLKMISLGMSQYIQDYDDKLPLSSVHPSAIAIAAPYMQPYMQPYGWADAIAPYLMSIHTFICPKPKSTLSYQDNPTKKGFTFYWLNGQVAGRNSASWKEPQHIILLGDGEAGDARYTLSALPESWRTDTSKPPFLHLNGANYAFADGHIKWFPPDEMNRAEATFTPR